MIKHYGQINIYKHIKKKHGQDVIRNVRKMLSKISNGSGITRQTHRMQKDKKKSYDLYQLS